MTTARMDRRAFLAGSLALTTAAVPGRAMARSEDYKALICISLSGGLDHADTVLPTDTPSWERLRGYRKEIFDGYGAGSGASSRDIANLLPLEARNIAAFGGRTFGLPREMANIHAMFARGEALVVGNTGALIEPTTREAMERGTAALPPKRHSHNDQEYYAQTLGIERNAAPGWGGRFIDALYGAQSGSTAHRFASVKVKNGLVGDVPFVVGDDSRAFTVPTVRPWEYEMFKRPKYLGDYMNDPVLQDRLRAHLAARDVRSDNIFVQDYADMSARARRDIDTFRAAYMATGDLITTPFPSTRTGRQLLDIARTIAIRGQLGNPHRQVFGVARGGFDIHSNQTSAQPRMLGEINDAVAAFRAAMMEIGDWENVALFTSTDFGRTTIGNNNGTDHGWGGHALVMGGAVDGGRIVGEIPPINFADPAYSATRGRLIPSTSVETLGASLGRWFGVADADLDRIFTNRRNFDTLDLALFR